MSRPLTELEGAILTEIAFRGNDTVYKLSQAFQASPSSAWSGSPGAIAPAVRRLTGEALIETQPHPIRKGVVLSVSASGHEALMDWASDPMLALGLGLDPFRLRAGLWDKLSEEALLALLTALLEGTQDQLSRLTKRDEDAIDERQTELAVLLLETRSKWLTSRLKEA